MTAGGVSRGLLFSRNDEYDVDGHRADVEVVDNKSEVTWDLLTNNLGLLAENRGDDDDDDETLSGRLGLGGMEEHHR